MYQIQTFNGTHCGSVKFTEPNTPILMSAKGFSKQKGGFRLFKHTHMITKLNLTEISNKQPDISTYNRSWLNSKCKIGYKLRLEIEMRKVILTSK